MNVKSAKIEGNDSAGIEFIMTMEMALLSLPPFSPTLNDNSLARDKKCGPGEGQHSCQQFTT